MITLERILADVEGGERRGVEAWCLLDRESRLFVCPLRATLEKKPNLVYHRRAGNGAWSHRWSVLWARCRRGSGLERASNLLECEESFSIET